MATFYLSSTYDDLKEFRQRVSFALTKGGHVVVGMENYTASGASPLKKCLEDVAKCDAYIGIFAWRYGFVPDEDNPQRKSITELEYLKAVAKPMEILIFILHDDAPWSPKLIDNDRKKNINRLRNHLTKTHSINFFNDPGELAEAVLTSVAGFPRSETAPIETPARTEIAKPISPAARPFWKTHAKLILGIAATLLSLFIVCVIYVTSAPRERVNNWSALFTKAEKLDDHWRYPKGMWATEPGDSIDLDKDDEALLVKGQEMGIPMDLDGKVFYNFWAEFKVRFKPGATKGAWVLRAQPDRASGYLFELGQEGSNLFLSGWIYEQKTKAESLGRHLLPFGLLRESQTLFVSVKVEDNKFNYAITFDDDEGDDGPNVGRKEIVHFQDEPSGLRWPHGTIGFLETDDSSVMRVEYVYIYPILRNK